jgi:hypothetical protein
MNIFQAAPPTGPGLDIIPFCPDRRDALSYRAAKPWLKNNYQAARPDGAQQLLRTGYF